MPGPSARFRLTRLLQRGADFERVAFEEVARSVRARAAARGAADVALARMPNRLAGATSPYLQQHADNPGRLVSVGRRGARAGAARGQADPAVDRLLGVPLVPRDGARVVRGRRRRRGDERRTSSTSRSTARSGPTSTRSTRRAHALLTRRSGGWPLTMFLTPDGAPFFGGTYFPKRGPLRPARLPRPPAAASPPPIASRATRSPSRTRRLAEALASARAGAPARRRAAARARRGARSRALKRSFDPRARRLRRARPSFRTGRARASACAHAAATGDADALDDRARDARAHGRRRHPRPARRRLLPLQRRRRVDDPALREDALRQRAAARALRRHARAPRGDAAFARRRARHRRLAGARDARAATARSTRASTPTAKARKASSTSGRATRCAPLLDADEWAVAAPYYGLDGPPNFEGHAWNLRVGAPLDDVAARLGIALPDAQTRSPRRAPSCAVRARATRVRPGLDDKILTSWNALAIAGLARAARALDEPRWADLAFARRRRAARARRGATAGCSRRASGERAAPQRLSRRPRLPARRAARAHADALPRAGLRLGARARRRAARALRGSRARRLLLHEPRSRAADPSHQARPRQRHAVGQRRRRAAR